MCTNNSTIEQICLAINEASTTESHHVTQSSDLNGKHVFYWSTMSKQVKIKRFELTKLPALILLITFKSDSGKGKFALSEN